MQCKGDSCNCRDVDEIYDVLRKLGDYITYQSQLYVRFLKYGYDKENKFLSNQGLKLYKRTLERYMDFLYKGYKPTINCHEVSKIIQQLNLYFNLTNCIASYDRTLTVDETNEAAWAALNPLCVSRNKWEQCMAQTFPTLQLTVTKESPDCNLVYELVKKEIFCDIIFDLQRTTFDDATRCKIEYNIVKREINCALSYNIYKRAVECGVSYEIIRTALECGLTFSLDRENKVCIITADGGVLTLEELSEIDLSCLENI